MPTAAAAASAQKETSLQDRYLRTKMLERSVAGRQKRTTRTSATAKLTYLKRNEMPPSKKKKKRLTMKKLVTVRIRGARTTTATTKQLPTRPTAKTIKSAKRIRQMWVRNK